MRRLSDWFTYAMLLAIIIINVMGRSERERTPTPPPELGPALPKAKPSDPQLIVELDAPSSAVGTAFAIDDKGTWLTARHVVDGCDQVALELGKRKYVKVRVQKVSRESDTALLISKWKRPPFARDFFTRRQVGERGYFLGFPQGNPGELTGTLLGRHRMTVRGRYKSSEQVLAWVETGRSKGLNGSIGGISGGPVFDKDGEIIGLVTAESPRRGRVYTVAPASLAKIVSRAAAQADTVKADIFTPQNYHVRANKYRSSRRIAQAICLVKS